MMSNLNTVREDPEAYKNIEEFFMSFYGQQADANNITSDQLPIMTGSFCLVRRSCF